MYHPSYNVIELLNEISQDKDSCFGVAHIRLHGSWLYEQMEDNPWEHKYRVILSADDYDYVEDPAEIAELDEVFSK